MIVTTNYNKVVEIELPIVLHCYSNFKDDDDDEELELIIADIKDTVIEFAREGMGTLEWGYGVYEIHAEIFNENGAEWCIVEVNVTRPDFVPNNKQGRLNI